MTTALPYSFASSIRRRATETPNAPALSGDGATITYGEADEISGRLAVALRFWGIRPGDRVAYIGRNRLSFPLLMFAASKTGAITTAFNWRLTATELRPILDDAEPEIIFVAAEFVDTVRAAIESTARRFHIIRLPDGPGIDALVAAADLTCHADSPADTDYTPAPDDIAMLTYTSGTTGDPKGVVITYRQIDAHCGIETPWRVQDDSTLLIVSPVFHAAGTGWLFLGSHRGAHMVLLPDADPRFITAALHEYRVTDALLVPALLRIALADKDFVAAARATLRTVVYGASAISTQLLAHALDALPDCDFVQGYGMSETIGPVTCLYPTEHHLRSDVLASAGTALPGIEIRIADPVTLDECPDGTVGEIWTRSPQNCSCYWRKPDATAALFHEDWLRTGDAGHLSQGYLFITDRIKDMINSGGEKIYAAEVERAVAELEGVADVCVIGLPDETWGETVCAIVVRAPDAAITADQIISDTRTHLAHFKCPTTVYFRDDLPRNAAGKVLRRAVRTEIVEATA